MNDLPRIVENAQWWLRMMDKDGPRGMMQQDLYAIGIVRLDEKLRIAVEALEELSCDGSVIAQAALAKIKEEK